MIPEPRHAGTDKLPWNIPKGELRITRREMVSGTMTAGFPALVAVVASTRFQANAQPDRHAHSGSPGIQSLMKEPLAHTPDPIVNVIMLGMAPGETSMPHEHIGPVFAYVLEGEIENQVAPDAPKRYASGDYFYEPPMHEHKMMRNLSMTQPAKLLIFHFEQRGKPFTIAMKNSV